MALLQKIDVDDHGHQYPLLKELTLIGREATCDIWIESGEISRRHAQIVLEASRYYLEDLNSRNGTFLQDRRIQGREPLASGDVIRFSTLEFVFYTGTVLDDQTGSGPIPPAMIPHGGKSQDSDDLSLTRERTKPGDRVEPRESGNNELKESKILGSFSISRGELLQVTTQDATRKLLQSIQLIESIGSEVLPDSIWNVVAARMFDFFPSMQQMTIVEQVGDGGRFHVLAASSRLQAEDPELCIPLIRRALQRTQAILYAEQRRRDATDVPTIRNLANSYTMCSPLIAPAGTCYGVIQADAGGADGRFDLSDLERLAVLSRIVAFSVDRLRL